MRINDLREMVFDLRFFVNCQGVHIASLAGKGQIPGMVT